MKIKAMKNKSAPPFTTDNFLPCSTLVEIKNKKKV